MKKIYSYIKKDERSFFEIFPNFVKDTFEQMLLTELTICIVIDEENHSILWLLNKGKGCVAKQKIVYKNINLGEQYVDVSELLLCNTIIGNHKTSFELKTHDIHGNWINIISFTNPIIKLKKEYDKKFLFEIKYTDCNYVQR